GQSQFSPNSCSTGFWHESRPMILPVLPQASQNRFGFLKHRCSWRVIVHFVPVRLQKSHRNRGLVLTSRIKLSLRHQIRELRRSNRDEPIFTSRLGITDPAALAAPNELHIVLAVVPPLTRSEEH